MSSQYSSDKQRNWISEELARRINSDIEIYCLGGFVIRGKLLYLHKGIAKIGTSSTGVLEISHPSSLTITTLNLVTINLNTVTKFSIPVFVTISSCAISPSSVLLNVGDTQQFNVTAYYSDGSTQDYTSKATYKSSNHEIVTVNKTGLATGISQGVAEFTATVMGCTATARIEVQPAIVLTGLTIEPASIVLQLGNTQQFTVTAHFSDGSTQDYTSKAEYTSSNPQIVTVSVTGLATGVALGGAQITAAAGEPPLSHFSVKATLEIISLVGPAIDSTVATDLLSATSFIYTGTNPVQTGVAADTIELTRVSILRGRVFTKDNTPLPGVTINILAHPELGQTITRLDGQFDIAVNGGGILTVRYEKEGFLSVQRQVQSPWQDYAWLPDVVMLPIDNKVTPIDLTIAQPQVAQGSIVTDSDGIRQATLLFNQGTEATMTLPDGTVEDLFTMNVRITEFSVGDNGPRAMPALLPANVAYTYCAEFTVDEAIAVGATEVNFNQPISFYLENFLDFPVGTAVPAGFYNRTKGQWIASQNGKVIQVVGIVSGLAELDIDGDGTADSANALAGLGITDAERQYLAASYQPGQTLWRVPITHFSPLDCNWPYSLPEDAEQPSLNLDEPSQKIEPCEGLGSIIGMQNQALGEAVAVAGTSLKLHYCSQRARGRLDNYTLNIPLSGSSIPQSLRRIKLEISIAGNQFSMLFDAAPNLSHTFMWDGKDVYGRTIQGNQPLKIRIAYVYEAFYTLPAQIAKSFARFSEAPGVSLGAVRLSQEVSLFQEYKRSLGSLDPLHHGLGGWTLNIHHEYDPAGRILYLGDGRKRSAAGMGLVITTVAGTGTPGYSGDGGPATKAQIGGVYGLVVGPDGSLYFADHSNNRIRKINGSGIITTVAGDGSPTHSGDGGPATQAGIYRPAGVDIAANGDIYIAEQQLSYIRRVDGSGIITTVAGDGTQSYDGENIPAINSGMYYPYGVVVSPDGSFYVAVFMHKRIRRVDQEGIMATVAGNGTYGYSGDGGIATQAAIIPSWLALAQDGTLYFSQSASTIRKVTPDGIIQRAAGNGTQGYSGDGGLALYAQLDFPNGLAFAPDGAFYIAEGQNYCIRKVNQENIITTVAGNGTYGYSGDGGLATQASLSEPVGLAIAPDGSIYVADYWNFRIRKVYQAIPGFSTDDLYIASENGSEVYHFNGSGRHLRTLNALTGAVLLEFQYDSEGRLSQIQDFAGNIATIERDTVGTPVAIVAYGGQRTTLSLNDNGYLSAITDPTNARYGFEYTPVRLLTSANDPQGNECRYAYDTLGRLTHIQDAAGGSTTLTRTEIERGYVVTAATSLGVVTTYRVESLTTGGVLMENTFADGSNAIVEFGTDGSEKTTLPDGTVMTLLQGPDSRFGMQAPIPLSITIATPDGKVCTVSCSRQAVLADPGNPFSLESQIEKVTVNGRFYTSTYESNSRRFTITTPESRSLIYDADELTRPTEIQIPDIEPISITYDGRNLVQIAQGGIMWNLNYNAAGFLSAITDPLSRSVTFVYDLAGRLVQQTLPNSQDILYEYDLNTNLIALQPPGRPLHVYQYTPVNLLAAYTPPTIGAEPTTTSYTYNTDRQMTGILLPDSTSVNFDYDAAGRLITIALPRGQVICAYDSNTGNISGITAPDGGTLFFDYDGALLTNEIYDGTIAGNVEVGYNSDFQVISRKVNGGVNVLLQYDQDDLITRAGDLEITRNTGNGLIIDSKIGNVITGQSYDSFGFTNELKAAFNTTLFFKQDYTRDAAGIITKVVDTIGVDTATYDFIYDLVGRLSAVRKNGTMTSSYQYDANGNRVSATGTDGTYVGIYDNQDRLLQYGAINFTYTATGALHTKAVGGNTTVYNYDAFGNLINVAMPNGTQIDYVIDGRNRRIGKKINGVLIQGFLYQDQLKPVAELDGNNQLVTIFIYGIRPNTPDYIIKNGRSYRIVYDYLGSVRLVVDVETGAVVQQIDYDEFGKIIQNTNPGFQPFGFAGGIFDEHTEFTRFGARDYDAFTGRWTSKDPIRFEGGDTNLYGYVLNNPINFIDSSGKQPINFIDPSGKEPFGSIIPVSGKQDTPTASDISAANDAMRKMREQFELLKKTQDKISEIEKSFCKIQPDKIKTPIELNNIKIFNLDNFIR